MKVRVKFNSDLRDKYASGAGDGVVELELKSDSKVVDVFDALHIDDGEIGFVLLNEKKVQKNEIVFDGDIIHIFSLVAGG